MNQIGQGIAGSARVVAVLVAAMALSVPRTKEIAAESPPARDAWSRIAAAFEPPAEYAKDLGEYRSPLVFDDGRPVRTAEEWKARREEIRAYWQQKLGALPQVIERPNVEVIAEERRENFAQKKVRLEAAPDLSIEGYLLVPEGSGPHPAVLVVYYEPETGAGLNDKKLRDFAYQLARRGFVALSIGWPESYTAEQSPERQPLVSLAYVAANCYQALASLKEVDPERVGVVGHSFGGKWAMFAACLYDKFACAAWSDPGIVFDEKRPNVNYWEPWYLGWEAGTTRKPGVPSDANPRTGPYKELVEAGRDLHELHALMAPRPFLVSGGSEDLPERWRALNHTVAVNRLLGYEHRVAMTNRPAHSPTEESNEQLYSFFEHFLKTGERIPVVYSTDLLHPHDDPDDHYDLACLFALPEFDRRGIILDLGERQAQRTGRPAVRQMEHITGRQVPTAFGLNRPLRTFDDQARDEPEEFQAGIEMLLAVLRESREPVTIFTTGSCRDVAAAFNREPELMRAKVKAIYFNVGRGLNAPQDEWNVKLDPVAYLRVFESGLPLYWCPCFGEDGYGTHYEADQSLVVGACATPVRNFFVYCLTKSTADPIEFLAETSDAPQGPRSMWCTGPMLHAAGRRIYRQSAGEYAALRPEEAARQGLTGAEVEAFRFVPMRAGVERTADPARLTVDIESAEPNGFVFRATSPDYPAVMASCLKNLLAGLGR